MERLPLWSDVFASPSLWEPLRRPCVIISHARPSEDSSIFRNDLSSRNNGQWARDVIYRSMINASSRGDAVSLGIKKQTECYNKLHPDIIIARENGLVERR